MDVTESTVDVELCEETEGEVSSTCNDNVRLDDSTVNSDMISSDCQSFVVSNDSSENTAVLQEETSHSLSPDTSGVVLRYVSEGDGVVCMPFETQGDMNTVEIQEDVVEEEVSLTSDLETVPEVSIPVANVDEREIISLEENVLISTTMDEGDFAVLNWEGEEIVEMSSADNLDLQEQMEQSVDVSSATQDTSSLDARGGAQLAAQSLPFASNPDSTTIETSEANNNIVIYENEVSTTGDELCMVSTSLVIPVSTTTSVASNESLSVPGSSTSVTAVNSSGNIPICMLRQRREESHLSSEISTQNSGISTTSSKDESAHKRRWDQVPVSASCNLSSNTESLLTSWSRSRREDTTVSSEIVSPTCSGKNQPEKVPKLDRVSSSKDSNLHCHTLSQTSVSDHQESNIDTTSQAQFCSVSHPSQKVERDLGSTSDSTTTDASVSGVASSDMVSCKEDYGNGATSSTSNDDSLERRILSVDDSNNQVSKSSEAVALEQNRCKISGMNNNLKSPHSSGSQDPGEIPEATHSGLRDNSEVSPSPLKDLHEDADKVKDNVVSHSKEDDRAKHTEASSGLLCTGTVPAEPCCRIDDRTSTSSGDPPTSSGGEKSSNTTVKHPERKSTDRGNDKSRFSILSGCRKPLVGSSVASETLKSSRLLAGKGSSEESRKESKTLEGRAESLAVEAVAGTSNPSSSGLHKMTGSTETKNGSSFPSQEKKPSVSLMASRNVASSSSSVSVTLSSPEERDSSKGNGNLGTLKANIKVSDSSLLKAQEYSKEAVELRQTGPKAEGVSATCSEDRQQDAPSLSDKLEIGHSESVIANAGGETTSSSTGDNMESPKEEQSLSKELGKIFSDSNESGPVAKSGELASLSTFEDPTEFDNQTTIVKSSDQLEEVDSIATKTSVKSGNDSEEMKSDHSETQKINPDKIKTYSRFTSEGGKSAKIKERPETVKTSRWDVATFAPKIKHDALHSDVAKISEHERKPSHFGDDDWKLGKEDKLASVKGISKASVSCIESTPKIGVVSSYCKSRDRPSGKETVTPVSKGNTVGHDPIVTAPCSSSKSEDLKSNILKSVSVESKLTRNVKSDPSLITKVDSISSSTAPLKTRVKLVRPPLSSVRESSSVTSSKLTILESFQEKLSVKKPEAPIVAKATSKGDVISTTEETDKELDDLDSEPHSFPKEMRTYSRLDVMQSKGSHSKKLKSLNTKEFSLERDDGKKEETQRRSITSIPKQATARPSIRQSYVKDCTDLSSKESSSPTKFETRESKMEKDDGIKSDDNVLFSETMETTETFEETTPVQTVTLKSVDEPNTDIETPGEVHLREEIKSTSDIRKSICDETEVSSTPSDLKSEEQHTVHDQPVLLETRQDRKTPAEDPSSGSKTKVNQDADMTSTDKCQSVGEELQRLSDTINSDDQISTIISSKSAVGPEIISLSSPGEKTTEHTVEAKETNGTKGGYGLPMNEHRSLDLEMSIDKGLEIIHKSEPTNPPDVKNLGCNLTHKTEKQTGIDVISEEKLSVDKPERLPEDRSNIVEVKQSSEIPVECPEEDVFHGHIKTDSQEIVKETTRLIEEVKDVAIVENSDNEKKSEKITEKSECAQKYEEHEILQMLTEEKSEECVKEPCSKENFGSFKSSNEEGIVDEGSVSLGVSSGVEDTTIFSQSEKEGEEVGKIMDTAGGRYPAESQERSSQSTADTSANEDLTKLQNKSDSSEQELKGTAINTNVNSELRLEVMEDTSQSEKHNVDNETSQPRAENSTDIKAGTLEAAPCVVVSVSESLDFNQLSKENTIQTPSASVENLGVVHKKEDDSIVSQSFDSQSDTIEVSKTSVQDKKEDITSNIVKQEEKKPEVMVPSEENSAIIKPDSTVELKISTCAEKTDEWEIFEGSDNEKSQKEDTDGNSSASGDELEEIAAFLRQSEEESRIGNSHKVKELGETVPVIITSSGDDREGSAVKESTVTEGKLEETEITVTTEHAREQEAKDSSATDRSEQNTTASSSQDIDKDVVMGDSLLSKERSKEVNQEDTVTESGSFSSEKVVSLIFQEVSDGKTNDSITEIDKSASEDQSQSGESRISSSNVEEVEPAVGKTEKIILKITKDKKSPKEFSVQEVEEGRKTESENSGGNNTAATVQDFELASSSDPTSLKVTIKASEQSAEGDRKTPITLKLVKDVSSEGKLSGPGYMSVPSPLEKEEGNVKKSLVASSENTKVDKFMSRKEARKLETSVSSSTSAVMVSSESTSQPSQVSSSGMSDESEVGKLTLKLKLPSSNETGSVAVVPKASTGVKPGSSKQPENNSVHEEEQPKVEKLTLKLKKDGHCENVTYTKSETKAEVSPKVEKLTIKTKTVGSSECIVAEPIHENALDTSRTAETMFADTISLEQSPKVEKLTLRLRKDSAGSDSSKSYVESSEIKHSSAEDSPKREKITLRIRTDSGSSEISNPSKRSRKDSCSLEVCESVKRPRRDSSNSEFSVVHDKTTSGSLKVTDTHTEECTSSEKITLTLRKVPSTLEVLSTQEKVAASGDSVRISEDDQLSSSVSKEENKVAKLTLKLKPDPSKGDKKDVKEASVLEDAITSTSNVDKSEETPRVEKLTLKLKKDQVGSAKDEDMTDSSASSDVPKVEKEQKVEKLTLKLKKDQVSSSKDENITDSLATSDVSKFEEEQKVEKLTLKLKKDQVSSAKDEDKTDSSALSDVSKFEKDHKEDQKVEKLTLKLKKDQVSSAKDEDITDFSASSDVSKFEEEQKVEKLTLKLKKDQVSSAKDEDKTDSSASSGASKFEKDHKEEQKVEKLTLKVKKDQVSSAKDEDKTDSSASSDVSKFEKDHKEEQKVEKLTLKLKKDQVSSAKNEDKTDSSASSDVSKFEKDHKEEQKVEKLTLKLKKDQVSSVKDEDKTDSLTSSDVSKFEKDHKEEQKVEKLTLKLKKDQVSSAKDENITDSSASSNVSKFEEEQKVEKLTLKLKKDQVSTAKDEDKTDSSALSDVSKFEKDHKEEQKVEKLTLKLKKDQVSSAKEEDITDFSASSDVSKFEEEQKVEKLALKLKKDQVSSAKDEDKTDSSASSDASKFEKDHKEEQKVEKLTLKVKKDQVSSAEDEDKTDYSASDVSKFEKDHKEEQKVEKLTIKLKKDQVSSAKDEDKTDSSASSDVSKFEKDHKEEQKVEKLTLKLKKDQVSNATDMDIVDSSASSDVSKFEKEHQEEQKVETFTLKVKKDQVSSAKDEDITDSSASSDISKFEEERKVEVEKLTLKLRKDQVSSGKDVNMTDSSVLSDVPKFEEEQKVEKFTLKLRKDNVSGSDDSSEVVKSKLEVASKEEQKVEKLTLKLKKDTVRCDCPTDDKSSGKDEKPMKEEKLTLKLKKDICKSDISDKEENKVEKLTIKRRKESAPVAETKQPLQYMVSPTEKKKPVTTGTGEEEVKFDKVTLKIKKDESKSEMTTPSLTDVKPHSEIKGKNSTSKSETVLPSSGIADKSSSKGETTALSASPSDQTCINVESKKCDSKSETVLSSSSTGEGKLSKVEVDKNSSKATPSSNTSEEICTDIEAIKNTSKSEEVLSSSGAGKRILSEVQIYKKSSEAMPSSNTSEEICGDEEAKKNVLKSEAVLSSSGAGEGMLFEAEFKKNSSKAAPSSNTTVVDTKKNASELEDAPQSLIVSDETLSNVLVAEENAEIETVSPSSSTTNKTQTNVKSNEVAPLLKRPLSSSLGDEKHTDKNISKTDGLPTLSSDKTDESHSEREIPPDETDESHSGRKMLSDKTDESHTGKEIKEADPKPEKVHSPPALNADSKQTDSKIEKDDLKDGTISQSSLHDKLHPGVCIKRADSEAEVIPSSTSSIRDETPTNQNIQNEVIEPGTVLPSSLSTKEKVHSDARIDEVVSPSEVSVTETEVKDNQKISSEVVSSEPTDTTSEVAKHSATYVREVQDLPVGKREVDKDKPVSEEQSKSDEDNDGNSIVERSPSEQYELSGREENIPELKTEEGKSSSSEPLLDDKEEGIRRLETEGEKQLKLEAKAYVKKEITPKLKAKEDKPLCSEARLDEKEEKAKLESGGEKILRLETKVDAKEGKMTTLKTKEEKLPDKGTELEDKEECKAKFETKGVELSRLNAKVEVKEEKMATLKTTEKKLSNTRLRLDDKEKGMKKMATKGEEHSEVGAKMDAKKKIKATVKAKGVAKLEMKGEKQFKLEVKTDDKDKITAVAKSKQEKVPNTGDKLDDKEEGMAKLETKEKQSKLEPKMDTKEKITATVKSEQEKLPSMAAKLDNKEEEMAKLQKGEKPSKLEQKMDAKEKITATVKSEQEKLLSTAAKLDDKEKEMAKLEEGGKLEPKMDAKEKITGTVKSEQEKLQITAAKLDDKEKEMGKLKEGGKLEPKMDAKEKITATVKSEQEKLPITAAKLDDKEKEMAKLEEGGKLEPKMDAKEKITATVKCKQEKLLNTAAKLGDKEEQMAKLQKGEKPSKLEPKLDADEEGKATLKIQEGKLSNTEAKSDENLGTKEEKATKLGTKAEKSPKLEAKIEKPALKRKIDSKTAKTFDAGADVDSENKITSKPSSSATENSPQKVIISVDSVSEKLIIGGSSEGFAVKKVFRAHEEATFEEKQLSKTEIKSTAKESSDLKDEEPKSKKLKVEAKVLESSVVPPPVDEVSQDVEVIYSVVEGQSDKQERIEPSPPRVEGKLREILSKMGGQASKLLDSDLSISISQPEATPPVSQAAPGYMKITLVQDDKEVINLDSDSDTVGSSAAVPIVGPSPEQFEPLGTMQGLSVDVVEPVKKKGRGRPRKSTLPAKPILPRPESESRPKRMCRGREGPIVQPKKPRGGGRGRGRGRASGMKRRADEDTPERMPGDRAFSEVSPGITASSPKVPRMSSLMDSTVSTSPPSSPPPSASLSSISVFGIPTPKCDNSLPSTTDSIVTTTTMITSPTAGVKPSSTFSSVLATAESTSTESAGVSTPVTTSASSAFFSLPTSVSPSTPSPKNAALTSSTSPIAQSNTITTQAVTSTDTSPVSPSKPAMSFLNSSPDSSGLFLSAPSRSEPELPTSGLPVSTVQVFEEETRMSADCGSRSQTPARTLPSAVGGDGPGEESQGSAISTATTESVKKKTGRMEVGDAEMKEFTVDQIAEYQWPPDKNGELLMVQEQISEYLGVKSFKRKYPDLRRRFIDSEERTYLREKGLVSEGMCDMGLTAIYSSEVLDVMFNDFQEKYEEYRRYQRDRQAKELTSKQKGIAAAASADKSKQDYKEKAISSAASWNAKFNKARKDGRRACFDLQSFTIHYPRTRTEKMAAKDLPKVGQYPIALIPGQFTDFYKSYTPTELRYFPLNTVLYGPMKPNERQEATGSDGSQSDSDESSSSDDSSSSSSSDGTQDTEETASTNGDGDQDVGPENGVADKEGPEKAKDKAGVKERDGAVCKVCSGDKGKNKEGRPEVLIHCATCTSSGHVSCFDLTLDMVPHIRRYDWQCTDCKTCIQCKDPADEDKMLFCDMCDRGYHIYCVGLRRVPNGRWHCKECAVCGSCGAQEPCGNADPSTTPNAQWQHEYKKGEKGTRVYAQTLCVPCSKLWRKGRYCQLCWRCYGNKPEEEVGLINCTVCDKWMHADCCNTVGGIEVNRSNYLCEICQEKGQARSPAVKLSMRPAVKV